MMKMLAGLIKPDDATIKIPQQKISYKQQTIAPKFAGRVKDLVENKLFDVWGDSIFQTEVIRPL